VLGGLERRSENQHRESGDHGSAIVKAVGATQSNPVAPRLK
jgi:hypothetical protein